MIKAACHVHSDWSYDGKWPLPKLAAAFARRGYHIVMMTEHDRGFTESRRLEHRAACAAASSDQVLLVPGIEYSDATNTVHILAWGPVPFLGEGVPTLELLQQVKACGGLAVMAHPTRRNAWEAFDASWANLLLGIEIWNRKTDGWAPSAHALPLLEGTKCLPFVGMDFHDRNQLFPLAMQLAEQGRQTEESVLECFRAHACIPTSFGRPVQQALGGWASLTLGSVESCRRSAAAVYRRFRKQVLT